MAFERITTNPDVMGGLPCIGGLRMPVATVVAMVADGMSVAEIIDDFPYLTPEDVADALGYAADARAHGSWPPAWFGAGDGSQTDTAARGEELLADGFGRSSS